VVYPPTYLQEPFELDAVLDTTNGNSCHSEITSRNHEPRLHFLSTSSFMPSLLVSEKDMVDGVKEDVW